MQPTPIWIVDADHWPRAYLRAELIERGHDAVGFVTVRDLLVRLALTRSPPALVIVDLRGQQLDDRRRAALSKLDCPILAVAGAGEVVPPPWTAVLRRPITIGAVADEAERLLASR